MKKQLIDLIGQKFSRLHVVSRAGYDKSKHAKWKCRCECGAIVKVAGHKLRSGHTRSCGCLRNEATSLRFSGANHYNFKGGQKNKGSVAWSNIKLAALKKQARLSGYASPLGTAEDVESLWKQCQGRCAICESDGLLSLDHCHTTGKLRGFLCGQCNTGVGLFYDEGDRLIRAALYLKKAA